MGWDGGGGRGWWGAQSQKLLKYGVSNLVVDIAQCLLYLSLEAVSKATILHVLVHQAGGGTIVAIGNQGQDVPMMIPKGQCS